MEYRQLGEDERVQLALLQAQGLSQRQIAAALDRAPSTVARELRRNRSPAGKYLPGYAQQAAHARRWRGARLERNPGLRQRVMAGFALRWSPQQIAERLAWETGRRVISHESLYRFVYAQLARTKNYAWRRCLPRAKSKRGWRGRKGGSPASFIAHRVPLTQRPLAVANRRTFGHWEADLMAFGRRGPVVLALHERHSRLLLAVRQGGKAADTTAESLGRLLAPLPPEWRQTLTLDNGTEFARHHRLHPLGIHTFFCDTHAPWQKGGVENAIGRLRRPLPRKTKLADLTDQQFTAALQLYNNTPRKCLGYRSPAEVFRDQVLHFKCELTFGPSQERWWAEGAIRGFPYG